MPPRVNQWIRLFRSAPIQKRAWPTTLAITRAHWRGAQQSKKPKKNTAINFWWYQRSRRRGNCRATADFPTLPQLTEQLAATRTEIAQHFQALQRLAGQAKKQSALLEAKTKHAAELQAQIDALVAEQEQEQEQA